MAKRLNIWQNVSDDVGYLDANYRNRIINGDFGIDQRNIGASLNNTTGNTYPVDRWRIYGSVASKFSAQQNYNISPPVGFSSHVGILSSSAYTVGSGETFQMTQAIEGYNVTDLAWGTTGAFPVTLSFWVQSSLSGSFGGSIQNSALNRSYPFLFNINSANTWEYKQIIIPGDTTGTWLKDNSAGIVLVFSFGAGSTYSGTVGTWAGADYRTATTAQSLVGTNGSTFYLTGVQLEKGSSPTPFEHLPMHNRIISCQRYYEKSFPLGTKPGLVYSGQILTGTVSGTVMAGQIGTYNYKVSKRASPTTTIYDNQGNSGKITTWTAGVTTDNVTPTNAAWNVTEICHMIYHVGSVSGIQWCLTAEAEI